MPEFTTTAQAVAKMHLSHVTQAEIIGLADEVDTLYDHVEGLSVERLAILGATLTTALRGSAVGPLSEDDPSYALIFSTLLGASSLLSLAAFVQLVLIEKLGVTEAAVVDSEESKSDFFAAARVGDQITQGTIEHIAGPVPEGVDIEAAKVEFERLIQTGVSVSDAARQVAQQFAPADPSAPKATAGDVDLPTGFYL